MMMMTIRVINIGDGKLGGQVPSSVLSVKNISNYSIRVFLVIIHVSASQPAAEAMLSETCVGKILLFVIVLLAANPSRCHRVR